MDLTANLISKILDPALISIAEKELSGTSDTSNRATKCKKLYESVRNAELYERIWLCCRTLTTLTKDGTDPDHQIWDYRYALPSDSNYIISLENDEDFTVESGYILTNYTDSSDQTGVVYIQIADVSSTSAIDAELARWDAGLINVMIARMATALALSLKKQKSTREMAQSVYEDALDKAFMANAYEDRHERHNRDEQESSWTSCRWSDD